MRKIMRVLGIIMAMTLLVPTTIYAQNVEQVSDILDDGENVGAIPEIDEEMSEVVQEDVSEGLPEDALEDVSENALEESNELSNLSLIPAVLGIQQLLVPQLKISVHVQDIGWMDWGNEGELIGTTGRSKRLEGIRIRLLDQNGNVYDGLNIEYRVHVQDIGWMNWVLAGEMAGTTGQSKRLEAIQIRLTGSQSAEYNIYYQMHCADFGWLGWAMNGRESGTAGFAKRLEAGRFILSKGEEKRPSDFGAGQLPYIRDFTRREIKYSGHVQGRGDIAAVSEGDVLGITGQSRGLEGVSIWLDKSSGQVYQGSLAYSVHMSNYGWTDYVGEGNYAGSKGQSRQLEAIKIVLTNGMQQYFDVYYSAHVANQGWMGWAKNGEPAGSEGFGARLEGLRIEIVPKGMDLYARNFNNAFKKASGQQVLGAFSTVSVNDANGTFNMQRALAVFNGIVLQPGQTLSFNGTTGYCGPANGYRIAGIVGGQEYGGGICQASTTLYGAAARAGLTIVERNNHSVPSVYVPLGTDAMVSWGTSDLKFRNDFAFPVMIYTWSEGKTLNVEIVGSDPGWFDSVVVSSWRTGAKTASAERAFYKSGNLVYIEALPSSRYR